jgi:hypothetical protein
MNAITCTYHCATCDRHFHSLEAFDAHRAGPWEARVCLDPEVDDGSGLLDGSGQPIKPRRFAALTRDGECRLTYADGRMLRLAPVTIWVLAGSLERARRRPRLRPGAVHASRGET